MTVFHSTPRPNMCISARYVEQANGSLISYKLICYSYTPWARTLIHHCNRKQTSLVVTNSRQTVSSKVYKSRAKIISARHQRASGRVCCVMQCNAMQYASIKQLEYSTTKNWLKNTYLPIGDLNDYWHAAIDKSERF